MEKELLDALDAIIGFETIAGNDAKKGECLDWVHERFFKNTPHSYSRGKVAGAPYSYYRHSNPQLLWFAHLDVVPGEASQFTIRRDGDTIFGRGVKDMKGAAVPFFIAYKKLLDEGFDPPVSILLTTDEELAGKTIPALLDEKIVENIPVAFTPDTGSFGGIVTEHKGAVWAEIIARGKGSHGAIPWKSVNPIYALAHAIHALELAYPHGTDDDWKMTVSITQLQGGGAPNIVPEVATATLDIRYPVSLYKHSDEIVADIQRHLPPECSLKITSVLSGLATDNNHPMVQIVQRIAEEVMKEKVPLGREHGATDARFFASHGIPAFLYGPKGGDLHAPGEWVSLTSLLQHVEFNQKFLKELEGM